MTTFRLNHMSIKVRDLARSAAFYRDVLGLPEIECGARKPNIRWFGTGEGQSIHLIAGDFGQTFVDRDTHVCLSSPTFDDTVQHLRNKDVAFCNVAGEAGVIQVRADGIRSVYLQDPDGYWLEINEDY